MKFFHCQEEGHKISKFSKKKAGKSGGSGKKDVSKAKVRAFQMTTTKVNEDDNVILGIINL